MTLASWNASVTCERGGKIVTTHTTSPPENEHNGLQRHTILSRPSTHINNAPTTAALDSSWMKMTSTIPVTSTGGGNLFLVDGVVSYFTGPDVGMTFWKPDALRGEKGLLEVLFRRTSANTSYLLLQTRPDVELRNNFSAADESLFDISPDIFKKSKTALAFSNLDETVDDDALMRGTEVKKGLKQNLPELTKDDFYLVKYRDYSDWAVANFSSEAKRDRLFSSKYVEKCFALRVGATPGVLIPITEAQLIMGHEQILLKSINVFATSSSCHPVKKNMYSASHLEERTMPPSHNAITLDMFKGLGVLGHHDNNISSAGGEDVYNNRPPSRNMFAEEQHGQNNNSDGYGTLGPAWYDWTPNAVSARIHRSLERQYKSVGKFVIKFALIAGCLVVAVIFVRRGLGIDPSVNNNLRSGMKGRRYNAKSDNEVASGGVVGSALRAVFATGPKNLLDLLLAPTS